MAKFEIIIKDLETGEELAHSKAKVIVGGYVPDEETQEGMMPANGMVAVKRSKAEIEREKDIGERKKRLKAMTELAKELRGNFAKGLVMNSKNREKILLGAAGVLSASAVSYMVTTHTRQVLEFVGKEVSDKYGENEKLYWAALESDPNRMIPALIYLSFENDSKASYYQEVYNGYPEHKENVWLNTLYDWLVSLGYEMSDEEIALRDGSHEVFKKEGKEA